MRPKLLLADDSITVQRVIELTLADEGLDVLTVGDGQQAVERIERDQPDIVLADLTMPGRDGYGVAEFVKQSPMFAGRTRVVLLTGAFEPIDQARADRLGIDGVLAKPFEPQAAIDLVRRVLSQSPRPVQPEAPVGTPAPAAASGYPFEPGAFEAGSGGAKSTPNELDEYFKRLDEALASAGHKPSAALRGVLDEPQPGKRSTMLGANSSESTDVTLGDAFSALLAAEEQGGEQGEPSEHVSVVPTLPATAFAAVETHVPAVSVAPEPAAPPAELTVLSEALVEQVVRRVLDEMSVHIVREIVNSKVLDITERLVREEIDRLKARAQSLDS
jgi:CheY-like chemotaxis protein